MKVICMRIVAITFFMSPFPFIPQVLLLLLCLLSSVINVALPSLCTSGRAEGAAQ